MKNLSALRIGRSYKKPLPIVSLVLIIFLLLIRYFLSLDIFSNLTENSTYLIFNKILDYTFYVSIGVVLLGFSTYLFLKKTSISVETKNTVKISIGIVIRNNKVLMVKRRRKEGKLLWQFPAGMIKPSKDGESTIIKEIKNETNIDCVIEKKIGERIHPDTKLECEYFYCKYISGKVINGDSDENSEARWVKIVDVKDYITSDLYSCIDKLFNSIKKINNE